MHHHLASRTSLASAVCHGSKADCDPAPLARKPDVDEAFDEAIGRVFQLQERICGLAERISPVLSPERENCVAKPHESARVTRSPLAEKLAGHGDMLDALVKQMDDILDRLQI